MPAKVAYLGERGGEKVAKVAEQHAGEMPNGQGQILSLKAEQDLQLIVCSRFVRQNRVMAEEQAD